MDARAFAECLLAVEHDGITGLEPIEHLDLALKVGTAQPDRHEGETVILGDPNPDLLALLPETVAV